MSLQQRVVERYAAALSKRVQNIVEVLKKGGYLSKGRRLSLMDKNNKVVMGYIPDGTFLSMLKKNILFNDDAWMRAHPDEPRRYILNPTWGKKKPRRKPGPPDGSAGYIQSGVLAGAYLDDNFKVTLTHAMWVDDRGEWLSDKTVCNKVPADSLANYDGGAGAPSCKVCATRVRKYKLPRLKRFED